MSKKQIHSRLENLFSNLASDGSEPSDQGAAGEEVVSSGGDALPVGPASGRSDEKNLPAHLTGWSWEIDANRNYVFCGLEVSDALRMNPHSFLGKNILSYGLHENSRETLEKALKAEILPMELTVFFATAQDDCVPVRMHVLSRIAGDNGIANEAAGGWRGFAQRIPSENTPRSPKEAEHAMPAGQAKDEKPVRKIPRRPVESRPTAPRADSPQPDGRKGYAMEQDSLRPAQQVWTELGKHSLNNNEMAIADASIKDPAVIAFPLQMQGVGDLLLEIVDDSDNREWTDDDRFLVMEVASQLALALDNAQLYINVQQELADRIRAEQGILRRNKDLATLNRIGQQLSRLATRQEIFELLSTMIGEVLNNNDLYICSYAAGKEKLSFPVYRTGGQPVDVSERPFGNGIAEHVIRTRSALLIANKTGETLFQLGVDLPERVPTSLLAIPMVAGERSLGAIVVQDFEHENAFDAIHVELLSTAVAQATTALENAELFQQMQNALEAIENRERYQANVARSAAILTEFGTKAMPDVLKALGQAAQCSRVYFAQIREDERGLYWTATADWVDPSVAYLFDKTRILHLPVSFYSGWAQALRDKGWSAAQSTDALSAETDFLNGQHIRSSLLLAVPGGKSTPSFLAFDQLSSSRDWHNEEISALHVAADAISNTFIREGLMDQLQITLEETEGLYKASNRLAVANDMQEMVSAVLSGVRATEINRAVLLLFEYDTFGKITEIKVGANWYNGRGTPPPPVGTEYVRIKYERFFQTTTPLFFEDILDAQIEKELQETLLHQNIRALAILPLLSGKRQTGVLMLQSETRHHFSGRETRTYPPLVDQMAIAVENQRLFEQTQVALSETELLYNVSNRIAQSADAQDMLGLVVETILPKGADQASLILISSSPSGELIDLEMVGAHDAHGEYQQMGMHIPISALPLVKSLTDEPLIISNINQHPLDPASRKTLEQYGIQAVCMVPLRSGGHLTGLLNASSHSAVEFSQDDTRLMRVVGNGIAVALEKQRLLRQAQRRALELQTASEIARDTASTLSLDLLLNRIVHMLSERFGFYHASIFLLDDAGSYAIIREATGEAGSELKQRGHRLAVGSRSVVGMVTATGEPFILNDVLHNPMHYPNPLLSDTRSEMGVPLKLGSMVIGALDLQSKEINSFNQDDVTVLQILADQIAIAIENARAYELSQKAISDMKEVDRVKSQFLANMSHELRTPLNSIIGFSRVILKGIDGPINDTQKQDLSAIYNSGQHLLSLITDILDLSKIEAGKMELSFADVNLMDMINSAMSTAVGLVKDKPIKLQTNIPDNLPLVRADNTRVRQVLINFLSNAAKFTDEGAITVDASIVNGAKGKPEVMLTVTDSGPGIAPQDQAKLFLPFSQVDDSPTRKTGGTGLGLSICRSLIDLHGGRIGLLRSEVGKGSTFFFTLPVVGYDKPDPAQPIEAAGNIVLAVDDDQKVIGLYERFLKPHGYQIVAVTDPKQAVARAKEVRPLAITLDIMMPEKDGWSVLTELKNEPETRDIPIIVCSILEDQEKGFSMGAADYLVKPFLQEDMINALGRLNRDGQIHEVMIIDDDPSDLRLVQKMLEDATTYHITPAQGGKQGWELIQEKRPDAIIMDLFMPEMNGFNILENLRANPALRNIPVIVLTGADLTPEHHQQLNEFGQGILSKGYLREKELLILLEEALRKFHPAAHENK